MLPSPKWADAAYRISDLTRDELLPQFVVLEGPTLRGYVLDNNKQNEVDPEESPKLVSELILQTDDQAGVHLLSQYHPSYYRPIELRPA